jgi:hypothetical protein
VATKKQTQTPATDETQAPVEQPAEQQEQPINEVEYLQAQLKALKDQLKAAQGKKVSRPSGQSKLEREIARQISNPTNYIHVALGRRIATRVKLGQDRAQATTEVRAQYALLNEAEVDRVLAGGDDETGE